MGVQPPTRQQGNVVRDYKQRLLVSWVVDSIPGVFKKRAAEVVA